MAVRFHQLHRADCQNSQRDGTGIAAQPARRSKIYPPSRAADGASSLRSTFFTISVSLAWVGARTPI
jgi:hypothetical protein